MGDIQPVLITPSGIFLMPNSPFSPAPAVGVLLVNLGDLPFVIEPMMRIAQLVVARHAVAEVTLVETLDATVRGAGGYGSTGT